MSFLSLPLFAINDLITLQSIDVAPRNVVSRVEKRRMHPTVVERIAFSHDGHDMITVDRRTGENGFDDVTSLKFWEHDITTNQYVLNTRVRTPHSKVITALTFASSPTRGKMVVTSSHDHKFKIWRPTTMNVGPSLIAKANSSSSFGTHKKTNTSTTATSSRVVWDCYSVGFYRDMPIHDAALSEDGSILAVAYSNIVTLWSPLENMLQHTLPHPFPPLNDGGGVGGRNGVTSVSFVGGSPLLVTTTERDVYVWNLLTCDVVWEIHSLLPFKVCCTSGGVSSDWKASARIAVVTKHKEPRVLLFNAMSPTPIFTWFFPDDVQPKGIWFKEKSEGVAPQSSTGVDDRSLLMVNENFQMYQLRQRFEDGSASRSADLPKPAALDGLSTSSSQQLSNFQRMFGVRSSSADTLRTASPSTGEGYNVADNDLLLVDGPSHVVPSVSSLFDTFMKQSVGENGQSITLLPSLPLPAASKAGATSLSSSLAGIVVPTSSAPSSFERAKRQFSDISSSTGMIQAKFDTASEEMLMEWLSKDGTSFVEMSKTTAKISEKNSLNTKKKSAPKSSKKKQKVVATLSSRKSKRIKQ